MATADQSQSPRPPLGARGSFGLWIAGCAIIGFGCRLVFALDSGEKLVGDAILYRGAARSLADGQGYLDTYSILTGHPKPTALHPPLFPLYLSVWTKLGLGSVRAHQIACCLLGALTVVLIGLLARRVAGARAGVVAGAVAAVYPPLSIVDGALNAESLFVPLIVLAMLSGYRFISAPSVAQGAALGVVIGLATLTRVEAILLLPLLAAPLAWRVGRPGIRTLTACTVVFVLVLTPWVVRNWITLDRFPLLSTNGGYTARATNCDATYYGEATGFVSHPCATRSSCFTRFPVTPPAADPNRLTEVHRGECLQHEANAYVRNHILRTPFVVLARVERTWEVYAPEQNIDYGSLLWGRARAIGTAALICYVLLMPFAAAGVFLIAKSSVPLWPLLSTLALATLTGAMAFGFTRYRIAAEPALIVLGAVAIERLMRALRGRFLAPSVSPLPRPASRSKQRHRA